MTNEQNDHEALMKMTFNKVLDIIIQLGFDEEDARMILERLEELELLNIARRK